MFAVILNGKLAYFVLQMRMRCRQPVLIQGDTGVGKTALLRNLCKILQWELHVLDVHGGLTVSNGQATVVTIHC
jgi:MoxR-like ATPase